MTLFLLGFLLGVFAGAYVSNKNIRDKVNEKLKNMSKPKKTT